MTMMRGADFRVSVNGTLMACRKISVRGISNPIDVSNTEALTGNPFQAFGLSPVGGPARSFVGDITHTEITLTCFLDPANSPFNAPHNFVASNYAFVSVFPSGLAGLSYGPYNMLVADHDHSGEAGQGAQMIELKLLTDGEWTLVPY